ncbi:MAG: DnaJ domain-containing protein [Deltaproteobacteria bacterium]|nr:DnaJ domain-containing protein [Deltaproteobacteria bacterium]
MDIRRSFKILEIGADATEDEARQAYKDLVAVWHPDRFSHNPRLMKKAEEKLKEANLAFETVQTFFATGGKQAGGGETGVSKTELAAELGTGAVLTLWSYLSDKINHILSDDVKKNSEKPSDR